MSGSSTKKEEKMSLPESGFVRLPEILSVIPVGKTTWWEGVKSGRYPKGVKLSARVTAWDVKEIRELIERLKGGSS
jgi:predicted DNA-binding transcriptional regulator AlpA